MTHNVATKECFFSTDPLVNSIENICTKLFDESGISHFGFSRVFDEGNWIDYTTSPEWTNYFYQNDLHKTSISGRLQEGVNYLKKSSKNEITHLQELSAKHFDLCNTLDFISRGNVSVS